MAVKDSFYFEKMYSEENFESHSYGTPLRSSRCILWSIFSTIVRVSPCYWQLPRPPRICAWAFYTFTVLGIVHGMLEKQRGPHGNGSSGLVRAIENPWNLIFSGKAFSIRLFFITPLLFALLSLFRIQNVLLLPVHKTFDVVSPKDISALLCR